MMKKVEIERVYMLAYYSIVACSEQRGTCLKKGMFLLVFAGVCFHVAGRENDVYEEDSDR